MNFLQLAQRLRQECEIPGTGPAAVTSQTGQARRLVDWVADAYGDIQRRHISQWLWLRRSFTFNTVAGTDTYAYGAVTDVDAGTAISRFARWRVNDRCDPALIYLQSGGVGGQYRLVHAPWDYFKQVYKIGTQNNSTPIHITVDPQRRLVLGPKPNGVYVVTGDFQRGVQELAANGDIPEMPTDFHMLIVYWAMRKYGANSVAQEAMVRANTEGVAMMRALEANQLPEPELAEPLA